MMLKSLMKKPMVMIGFLCVVIFMYQLRDNGFFAKRNQSLIPTSCKPVKVRLDKFMHASWDIECNGNNLMIEAPVDDKIAKQNFANHQELQRNLYRALANVYISIAKYSPPESLERTMIVSVRLVHPKLTINSVSEGKHVRNMKDMKDANNLARHFRQTVQVQEVTE